MSTMPQPATVAPVRKSVVVDANIEEAFRVFTDEFDSWWPRTHHIGKSPMTHTYIEGRVGGRCYSDQEDGTSCSWGTVTTWEPPRRFVFAWQITPQWGFEPDVAKSSEVEVRFADAGAGRTRVDLEHRHFERHGAGADAMRTGVDSPNGWGDLLALYAARTRAIAAGSSADASDRNR